VYFAPAIVAGRRGHHNTWAIFLVNLFASWTVIAWVVAWCGRSGRWPLVGWRGPSTHGIAVTGRSYAARLHPMSVRGRLTRGRRSRPAGIRYRR
jgi:hypothetical protein